MINNCTLPIQGKYVKFVKFTSYRKVFLVDKNFNCKQSIMKGNTTHLNSAMLLGLQNCKSLLDKVSVDTKQTSISREPEVDKIFPVGSAPVTTNINSSFEIEKVSGDDDLHGQRASQVSDPITPLSNISVKPLHVEEVATQGGRLKKAPRRHSSYNPGNRNLHIDAYKAFKRWYDDEEVNDSRSQGLHGCNNNDIWDIKDEIENLYNDNISFENLDILEDSSMRKSCIVFGYFDDEVDSVDLTRTRISPFARTHRVGKGRASSDEQLLPNIDTRLILENELR